jgi:hypothetical protein
VANFDVSGQHAENGVFEETTLRIFQTPSAIFPNVRSVRVDGGANQLVWDTLLQLPAFRELRLWRMCRQADPLSHFRGLFRLQALEIGMLLPQEAVCLGRAVQESRLETLHISSSNVDRPQERSVLAEFFTGLTVVSIDLEGHPKTGEESSGCFPSSLMELAIEDDCRM